MREPSSSIVVLDYGSQYTRLIARRLREANAYSVILPPTATLEQVLAAHPAGIILSGGPASVYDEQAPTLPAGLLEAGVPVLGVCYGMQLLARAAGAPVTRSPQREYGKATLESYGGQLFAGVEGEFVAWMSHGDSVESAPAGFTVTATTTNTPVAAFENTQRGLYGLQFHPEVVHTPKGGAVLENFLAITGVSRDWTTSNVLASIEADVRSQVGEERVLLAISGGVDSSTLGLLLARVLGEQLTAVFVDHGLLRHGEAEEVEAALTGLGVNLTVVHAQKRFLNALAGVVDPETKRKIIGREFVRLFEEEARRSQAQHGKIRFLAQGTLYPDVIESAGGTGAANIKSHHNVGGLPEEFDFELLEPFRYLFKDEVRDLARQLGMPEALVERHPFPGPGLAVRCLGEVTAQKLDVLRRVDNIFISALHEFGLYQHTWQALAVLTPVRSVGVMGDGRTYAYTAALRAVNSVDGMTADWVQLPHDFLATVSSRITNAVPEVNRVVYDITSKPPATIEWE